MPFSMPNKSNLSFWFFFSCLSAIFAQNVIVVGQDLSAVVTSFALRRILGSTANITLATRYNELDSSKFERLGHDIAQIDEYSALYGVKGGFVDFLGKELKLSPCTSTNMLQLAKVWKGDGVIDLDLSKELQAAGESVKRGIVAEFDSFYNGQIMGTMQGELEKMGLSQLFNTEIQRNHEFHSLLASESVREFLGVCSSYWYQQSYENIHGFAALAAMTPFLPDSVCYQSTNITQKLIDYANPIIRTGSPVSFINQSSALSYSVHSWAWLVHDQQAAIFTDDEDGVSVGFMLQQRERFPFDRREHESIKHFGFHVTMICGSLHSDYHTPESSILMTSLTPDYDVEFVSIRLVSSSCVVDAPLSTETKTSKRPAKDRPKEEIAQIKLYEIVSEDRIMDGSLDDVFTNAYTIISRRFDLSELLDLTIDSVKAAANRRPGILEARYGANFIWGDIYNYLSTLDDFVIMSAFNAAQLTIQALGYETREMDRYIDGVKVDMRHKFDVESMSRRSMLGQANKLTTDVLKELRKKVDPEEFKAFEEYKTIVMGGLDMEVDLLGGIDFSDMDLGSWSNHCPLSKTTKKLKKTRSKEKDNNVDL